MTKLPHQFEICTKYDRATRFRATLDSTTGKYTLRNTSRLEDAYDAPLAYSAKFVQEAIDCGNWIVVVTKDMSPATEPELVFPIYAKHSGPEYQDEACPEANIKIEKGDLDGFVKVTWGDGSVNEGFWSVDSYKRLIEQGIWIVKHVGEKAPEVVTNTTYLSAADLDKISITSGTITARSFSVQAPQSAPLSNLSLSIKCDTDAAVEAVERLTQALEDLAISYESVIALQRDFKEGV